MPASWLSLERIWESTFLNRVSSHLWNATTYTPLDRCIRQQWSVFCSQCERASHHGRSAMPIRVILPWQQAPGWNGRKQTTRLINEFSGKLSPSVSNKVRRFCWYSCNRHWHTDSCQEGSRMVSAHTNKKRMHQSSLTGLQKFDYLQTEKGEAKNACTNLQQPYLNTIIGEETAGETQA